MKKLFLLFAAGLGDNDPEDNWETAKGGNYEKHETWDFKVNPIFTGYFISKTQGVNTKNGPKTVLKVFNKTANVCYTIWCNDLLEQRMNEVEELAQVKITFEGKVQGKKNDYNSFKVQYRNSEKISLAEYPAIGATTKNKPAQATPAQNQTSQTNTTAAAASNAIDDDLPF